MKESARVWSQHRLVMRCVETRQAVVVPDLIAMGRGQGATQRTSTQRMRGGWSTTQPCRIKLHGDVQTSEELAQQQSIDAARLHEERLSDMGLPRMY